MRDLKDESMFDLRFMLNNEAKSDPKLASAIEKELKLRQLQNEKEAEIERLSKKWSLKEKLIILSLAFFLLGSIEISTYSGYRVYQDGSQLPYEKTRIMFRFPPFLHYFNENQSARDDVQPTKT